MVDSSTLIPSNREPALKTRDIATLTNPHLPLSNNGYNPPLRQKMQVVDNADFFLGDFPCYFFQLNFTVLFTEAKL